MPRPWVVRIGTAGRGSGLCGRFPFRYPRFSPVTSSFRDRVATVPLMFRACESGFVTDTWLPETNGVTTVLATMDWGFQQRGHTVQVIAPRYGRDEDDSAGF